MSEEKCLLCGREMEEEEEDYLAEYGTYVKIEAKTFIRMVGDGIVCILCYETKVRKKKVEKKCGECKYYNLCKKRIGPAHMGRDEEITMEASSMEREIIAETSAEKCICFLPKESKNETPRVDNKSQSAGHQP